MLLRLKLRLSKYLLRHLFCAVGEESFLQVQYSNAQKTKGVILHGTKPLEPSHVAELASQSRMILRSEAWQKVTENMKGAANDMLFNKSKSQEDMIAGKMVLYALDILRQKFENIARLE